MKLLFCAACLCSAGVFVSTAMTQERESALEPATDNRTFNDLEKPKTAEGLEQALDSHRVQGSRLGGGGYGGGGGGIGGGGGGAGFLAPAASEGLGFGGAFGRDRRDSDTLSRPRTVRRTILQTIMEPIPPEELEAMQKLQAAIQQLKTGEDDAARKAAADTIQQQLTTQFEVDLQQREKELAEVEQRVTSLREQLDKRKAAQADIINLRLQTLINDANGLGFPDVGFRAGEPIVQEHRLDSNMFERPVIGSGPKTFFEDTPLPTPGKKPPE